MGLGEWVMWPLFFASAGPSDPDYPDYPDTVFFTDASMTRTCHLIARARVVMRDDSLIGSGHGRPVRFQETL